LQKLVQAQAKEMETLKKREQVRQGKQKVVEAGPAQEVEKQPQRAGRNDREGQQNNPDNPEVGGNLDPRNAKRQLEIRISHQKKDAAQQDLRAASRIGGANPPPARQAGPQEHIAENIPEFGYIDYQFTPWIMSHALPHGFQFAK
jgi:hypothetical protein